MIRNQVVPQLWYFLLRSLIISYERIIKITMEIYFWRRVFQENVGPQCSDSIEIKENLAWTIVLKDIDI